MIATNYSKGISILSDIEESNNIEDIFSEPAPLEIQELYSRNELIQKFSEKKYFLTSSELNNLLGEENYSYIKEFIIFEWRNWKLIPKNKKYWIIENIGC